ncbi:MULTISPECIES: hypothetical protein [Marinobacter]|uniref:hypothetical protein n=1 Tax=Marinobacter sp. TaxID=50741 RepID=UPI0029C41361|nr:hypothetical protein [Marinobacter sp.]MDX5335750.1 hypothetical protein [Marinobacter sp.]MDX5386746.1 hypothetical protein [Marinobacter sp.]MDX5440860.1 hypothetical protein [Alteromonadaceae bacterium]MDX5472157.1 hypothetical protein [Marinobacter sp.]
MAPVIQRTLVTLALMIGPVQGMVMSKTDVREDEIPEFEFTEHCAGRYQLELPADMELIRSGYNDELILASVYPPDEVRHDTAYRGEHRVDGWRSRVEAARQKEPVETRNVHWVPEGSLKTLVYYADYRKIPGLSEDPAAKHVFKAHFLKDFSTAERSIAIQGQGGLGFVSRDEPEYKAIYHERLTQMQERAQALEYHPWPHNKPGVCLDREFVVVNAVAPEREGYSMQFVNGKGSWFTLKGGTYTSEGRMKEVQSEARGMLAFLASSSMKVAGRKGRLFISDGKYSETEREFRWIATDSEVNSFKNGHFVIEGAIEMKDYPEMAPMKGTDVIVGLLKGVRERPYGMLDVKR